MIYIERWYKPCRLQVIFDGPSWGGYPDMSKIPMRKTVSDIIIQVYYSL